MYATSNIFEKEIWNDQEWNIYIGNLEILRKRNELKKQEFSHIIGVRNAFRRDIGKPSQGTILKICIKFNVTENWLGSPNKFQDTIQNYGVKENQIQFDLSKNKRIDEIDGHEFWRAHELLNKIYKSGNQAYIKAIFSSLVAFTEAIEKKP